MRQWQMLRLIPRQPSKISTTELMQRLADKGFSTTPRSLQRDLVRMSSIYPLVCDDRDKPFGWSWDKHANVHEVPGINSDTALAFYLAEKYLEPLLPRTILKRLAPHFKRAGQVLDQADADKGNPAWRNKVRVLHRGPGLKNPAIIPDVQSAVYDALLRNRRLDDYIASGELDFAVGDGINLKAWISADMAVHLQERPLHSRQVISEPDDGRILLDVTVQDTNELRWWLLGFGDQVEILKPVSLREYFRVIIQNMAKAYA